MQTMINAKKKKVGWGDCRIQDYGEKSSGLVTFHRVKYIVLVLPSSELQQG